MTSGVRERVVTMAPGGRTGRGTTSTRMATNPHNAMNASVTNPSSRNQTSAHDGPMPQAPPSSDGSHSMR